MQTKSILTRPFLRALMITACSDGILSTASATGDYNPLYLLEDTAFAAIAAPEFWFELEMKDLAKRYEVKEKYLPTREEAEEDSPSTKPPEKPKPALETQEGKLYQAGADAYHADDFAAASKAWRQLLDLPEAERKERSVWAEYMLGRVAIAQKQLEEAPPHFQAARKLAAAGFTDEQGLASASYGWEAFVYKESKPSHAMELYLQQLATGDPHALLSIRYTLPGSAPPEDRDEQAIPDHSNWGRAATDPLMREIITRWHLAYGADANNSLATQYPSEEPNESLAWLKEMEKVSPAVAEADRLAWLAYRQAAYDQAQRWLKLATKDTALSAWLQAKLALRAGDSAAAEKALAKVSELTTQTPPLMHTVASYLSPEPHAAALADLGAVLLSRDKYTEALTSFLAGDHWMDAAYVAERVLTLKELQAYVDAKFPKALPPGSPAYKSFSPNIEKLNTVVKITIPETPEADPADKTPVPAWDLRWLLARRMVREDQEAAARPYFPKDLQPILDAYLAAISKGGNDKLPALERARGWWEAAWIARQAGLHLLATEAGPDNAWQDGAFELASLHQLRRLGQAPDYGEDGPSSDVTKPAKKFVKVKFSVPPSAEEKKRLAKNALAYEYRHHYRWVAAALAKKAAALLPAGSEERADVLNTAGSWMFSRDEKREEEFFFAIKETCPKTQIGKKVLEKKHTFELGGPWSGEAPAE